MTHSPTKEQTAAAKILADTSLSKSEKFAALRARKRELQNKKADLNVQWFETEAARDVVEWVERMAQDSTYSAVDCSALHKMQALPVLVYGGGGNFVDWVMITPDPTAPVFLMQHDWQSLIEGTDAEAGEWMLPAEECIFEVIISGKRAILFVSDESMKIVVESRQCWVQLDKVDFKNWQDQSIGKQIRALCILLEAEAIEAEVVRAPHKLNATRERRGKLPIYDHHILKLKDRKRYGALEPSGNERASPRLHFRRGHWRHYQEHKTWIKWQLVGDASLGFVDKDYAY